MPRRIGLPNDMFRLRAFALYLALAAPAPACAQQDGEVQRALMQRDQMSQEFALGLQQYQLRARIPAADALGQQRMEALFLQQRQAAEAQHQQQLLDMRVRGRAGDPVQAHYDVQRFARDRQAAAERFDLEVQTLQGEPTRATGDTRHTPTLEPGAPRWAPSL